MIIALQMAYIRGEAELVLGGSEAFRSWCGGGCWRDAPARGYFTWERDRTTLNVRKNISLLYAALAIALVQLNKHEKMMALVNMTKRPKMHSSKNRRHFRNAIIY